MERSDRRSGMGIVGNNTGLGDKWGDMTVGIEDDNNGGGVTSDGERIGIVYGEEVVEMSEGGGEEGSTVGRRIPNEDESGIGITGDKGGEDEIDGE